MTVYRSSSAPETKKFAAALARRIKESYLPGKEALLLALKGDLGAGKTVFSKGFLSGFGIKRVTSPTFVIMKRYKIRGSFVKNLYHFDCYRLHSEDELKLLGISSIIKNPENVIIMEWPQNAGRYGRGSVIDINLGDRENERTISIKDKKIRKFLNSDQAPEAA